jgi:hypothetical protein
MAGHGQHLRPVVAHGVALEGEPGGPRRPRQHRRLRPHRPRQPDVLHPAPALPGTRPGRARRHLPRLGGSAAGIRLDARIVLARGQGVTDADAAHPRRDGQSSRRVAPVRTEIGDRLGHRVHQDSGAGPGTGEVVALPEPAPLHARAAAQPRVHAARHLRETVRQAHVVRPRRPLRHARQPVQVRVPAGEHPARPPVVHALVEGETGADQRHIGMRVELAGAGGPPALQVDDPCGAIADGRRPAPGMEPHRADGIGPHARYHAQRVQRIEQRHPVEIDPRLRPGSAPGPQLRRVVAPRRDSRQPLEGAEHVRLAERHRLDDVRMRELAGIRGQELAPPQLRRPEPGEPRIGIECAGALVGTAGMGRRPDRLQTDGIRGQRHGQRRDTAPSSTTTEYGR